MDGFTVSDLETDTGHLRKMFPAVLSIARLILKVGQYIIAPYELFYTIEIDCKPGWLTLLDTNSTLLSIIPVQTLTRCAPLPGFRSQAKAPRFRFHVSIQSASSFFFARLNPSGAHLFHVTRSSDINIAN